MKKIVVLFLFVIFLFSCKERYTYKKTDDGIVRSDMKMYYAVENSSRYTDSGIMKKVKSDSVTVIPTKSDDVIISDDIYYVAEEYKNLDVLFEQCNKFVFVPKEKLDKNLRPKSKYIGSTDEIENPADFSFYVFYGRTPEEEGCVGDGEFQGEVLGIIDGYEFLFVNCPVYLYSGGLYAIEIDGERYVLEDDVKDMIFKK